MKYFVMVSVMSLGILLFNNPVFADDKGSYKGSMSDGEISAEITESGAIKVGNKICPISKEDVGEEGEVVEYEYEGKIYNFCCKMCLKDFKKDPEKYIKMIDASMAGEESEEGHAGHDHPGE